METASAPGAVSDVTHSSMSVAWADLGLSDAYAYDAVPGFEMFESTGPRRVNVIASKTAADFDVITIEDPLDDFESGEDCLFGLLPTLHESGSQTDIMECSSSPPTVQADVGTQTPNRNSDLNFCSNRGVQTDRRQGGGSQSTEVQTDDLIGTYSGTLKLPNGLSVRSVVEAVVACPSLEISVVARQLATPANMQLSVDKSLGLVEVVAAAVADTLEYVRLQLIREVTMSRLVDPSGSNILEDCSRLLDRLADRPARSE